MKKITRKQGGIYKVTVYIDGLFEHSYIDTFGVVEEQTLLHIMDDQKRIASLRTGSDFGDTKPPIQYFLDDHLGSSSFILNNSGGLESKEEYYPFGETSFGSFAKKRYRFCGKEKDEESGLYFYGMRYYAPWICRFVSVDPLAAKYCHLAPFAYADNKPINFTDIDGAETGSTEPSPGGGNTSAGPVSKGAVQLETVIVTGTKPAWLQGVDFEALHQEAYDTLLHVYENDPLQRAMGGTPEAFKSALWDRVGGELGNALKHAYVDDKVGWRKWVPGYGSKLAGDIYKEMGEGGYANLSYTMAGVDVALTVVDLKLVTELARTALKAAAKEGAKEVVKTGINSATNGVSVMSNLSERFPGFEPLVTRIGGSADKSEIYPVLQNIAEGDWIKVYQGGHINGKATEIHFYLHKITGQIANPKVKFSRQIQKALKDLEF